MRKRGPSLWAGILRWAFLGLCGVLLGWNLYCASASGLVGNPMPMPFGYGSAVVLSGSMEPAMSKGDLILVRETDRFFEGQIVVFEDGGMLVVHRIVNITQEQITTRGDANNTEDDPILPDSIQGEVIAVLPGAGRIVEALRSPAGLLVVLLAAFCLMELPHLRRRKKDEEDLQKLKEEIQKLKEEL